MAPHAPRPPALAAALLWALAACGGGGAADGGFGSAVSTGDHVAPTWRPSGHAAAGDAFVHLFEWRWDDVAQECPRLAALGYRGVQVSPPNEHLLLPGFPWYQRYQPVSYRLDRSRSGTLAELRAMLAACAAAGVEVYADAVVNHLTAASSGTGSAGGAFSAFDYPAVPWSRADFRPPCPIQSYQDAQQVRACQLVGLQDLDTGAPRVRATLARYLATLVREGFTGYRIDAAKHVSSDDLDAVFGLVAAELGGPAPWAFLEVIDPGTEAVTAAAYLGVGYAAGGSADVTEFRALGVFDRFAGRAPMSSLSGYPDGWGLMPAGKAVVFATNHDTERSGPSYKDGAPYRLASLFLLAHPYGHAVVHSGYAFSRADAGPRSGAGGDTLPIHQAGGDLCRTAEWLAGAALADGDWLCQHRDPAVAALVRFRREVAGEPAVDFQAPDAQVVGFGRGAAGFAAFNAAASARTVTFATRLPAGTWCDLVQGGRSGAACAPGAAAITVDAAGTLSVTLPAHGAVALAPSGRL